MLKPTTDPNAGDARRDVEPTPASPAHSNSRRWQQAWSRMRGRAIEAPGEPGIISAEEDVLDINYEHSGP